ncbi:hypothetical protein A4S06_07175 [Erysipelotrichaceae bacterium MTC7]|nr:hypothetical protein A4S06_07175 [Erysipelotrichaceae bacterium MTC7]
MKTILLFGQITEFFEQLLHTIDVDDIFGIGFFLLIMFGGIISGTIKNASAKQKRKDYQTKFVPDEMKRQQVKVDLTSTRRSASKQPRRKDAPKQNKGFFTQISEAIQAGIDEANGKTVKQVVNMYKPNSQAQSVHMDVANNDATAMQQDIYNERNRAYEAKKKFEKKHPQAHEQSILETTMDQHEQNVLDAESAYTAAYDTRMENDYRMFAWEPVVPKEAKAAEPAIEAEPALSVEEEKGWIII